MLHLVGRQAKLAVLGINQDSITEHRERLQMLSTLYFCKAPVLLTICSFKFKLSVDVTSWLSVPK